MLETSGLLTVPDGAQLVPAGGLLRVRAGGTLKKTGAGSVTLPPVENLGLLTGTGTIAAAVVNKGVVAPGSSPGTLSVQGTYTQGAGGALRIDLVGVGAAELDRLLVSGNAALAGTLAIQRSPSFIPPAAATFTFLHAHTVSGMFTATSGGSVAGTHALVPRYELSSVRLVSTGVPPPPPPPPHRRRRSSASCRSCSASRSAGPAGCSRHGTAASDASAAPTRRR